MAFEFQRSYDYAAIEKLVTSDRWAWAAMTDDTCPSREDFRMPEKPEMWFVLVREEKELVGVWSLHPETETSASMHCCLVRSVWGEKARAIAKEWLAWVRDNTPFTRLTTAIPECQRPALAWVRRVLGMREFNVIHEIYPKHGRMHNLIEFELFPGGQAVRQADGLSRKPTAGRS